MSSHLPSEVSIPACKALQDLDGSREGDHWCTFSVTLNVALYLPTTLNVTLLFVGDQQPGHSEKCKSMECRCPHTYRPK